mmetsp:Transcript_8854/g.32642  ORF Transcript_8854/g.32642 Transcript_8854/m.32642 type:complete len:198 (-) Transcript_8854:335-928(-)
MGNTFRKGEGAAPSQPQQRSKAEEHLHQAVVRYSQSSTRKPIKNLNRILLKLGDVGRAFNDCRKWFDEGDIDKDQTLSLTETKALLRRLGITLPDEEIQEIFASTDTDHNKRLSFKEFVTLLALTALLQEQSTQTVFSEQSQVALTDALSAIHVAVECFLLFDINHDGEISKEEIGKMMVSHSVAHEKEVMLLSSLT